MYISVVFNSSQKKKNTADLSDCVTQQTVGERDGERTYQLNPGRKKVGRWNEQSALQGMCDAEKDWHERSFRASGVFGSRQNLPFNKPEISLSFLIFQPAVHYD